MEGLPDNPTEKYREYTEEVVCPFCKQGKVAVTYVAGYVSWGISRISAGAKRTRYYHDPKVRVGSKCPSCGKPAGEIKEVLDHGGKVITPEERLRRLKESGLPTIIETKM